MTVFIISIGLLVSIACNVRQRSALRHADALMIDAKYQADRCRQELGQARVEHRRLLRQSDSLKRDAQDVLDWGNKSNMLIRDIRNRMQLLRSRAIRAESQLAECEDRNQELSDLNDRIAAERHKALVGLQNLKASLREAIES